MMKNTTDITKKKGILATKLGQGMDRINFEVSDGYFGWADLAGL